MSISSSDVMFALGYRSKISILIVTATDLESKFLLRSLKPLPGELGVIQSFYGEQTYYLGVLGIYGVAMVQSEMGAVGRNSSLLTTITAIHLWRPKAIIMLGIAFGINSKKQNIGDVIVSSHIIPYENARVGTEIIYRSPLPSANSLLINRVRQIRDWKFLLPNEKHAKVYLGPLLTGEKLIDNLAFRDMLLRQFPNAIGGEMESAGIYAAADSEKVPWIIIKGICDFADGNKSKNKDLYQELAIRAAISFTDKLLSNSLSFSDILFIPLLPSIDENATPPPDSSLIALLVSLKNLMPKPEESFSDALKVAAHEVVQTGNEKGVEKEAATIKMLIPKDILDLMERRVNNCWDMYREIQSSEDGYLSKEMDRATKGVQACLCRELKRILELNKSIPEGIMADWWNAYECASK